MTALAFLTALVLVPATLLPGCGCSLTDGGESDRALTVTMGGKVTTTDRLDFEAVSYAGQRIQFRNRAKEHTLDIGAGTPILAGDGTVAAKTTGSLSIAPGKTGTFGLTAPLSVGQTYYLGAAENGGKPNIRQLFICPGGSSGGAGGGGITVPDVQDVEIPE